ncbi:MAG: sulfite exporter TauE/SafE family protein [Thermoplasmata archaeon]|nr:sulfite exporter TauE/SafE family protein [Thermoplasmata archaeon]
MRLNPLTVLLLSFSLGALRSFQFCGVACGAILLSASAGEKRRSRYVLKFLITRVALLTLLGSAIGLSLSLLFHLARVLKALLFLSAIIYIVLALALLYSGWRALSASLDRLLGEGGALWVERRRPLKMRRYRGPYSLGLLLSIGCIAEISLMEGLIITAASATSPIPPFILIPLSFLLFALGMNLFVLPVMSVREEHVRWIRGRPVLSMLPPLIAILLGAILLLRYTAILIPALL